MALKKPKKSVVSYDLNGKSMLLYGTNSTGKTFQATHFPKPVVFAAEYGLNGLNDIPYYPINKWGDYVSLIRDFQRNLEEAKEEYQTIIVDEVSVLDDLCKRYICETYGVNQIKDGNNGYGLWQEYRGEWKKARVDLMNMGFATIFIAHEGTRDFQNEDGSTYSKIYPGGGDKVNMSDLCDACDIIAYARVNNPDENGNEVKSSLYLKGSRKFHARSRFPAMTPYLKEFTADNLQKAIHDAIEADEEINGYKAVSYTEQQKNKEVQSRSYDELFEAIKKIAVKMNEKNMVAKYKEVVEKYLGAGRGVQDTTPAQTQALELILDELKDFAA